MRPILIQGQMDIETDVLFDALEGSTTEYVGNMEVHIGTIEGYPVIAVNQNPGEINASMNTALCISKYDPLFIINQGTCGGHIKELHVGDVVLSTKVVYTNFVKTPIKEVGEGSDSLSWEPFSLSVLGSRYTDGVMSFEPDKELFDQATTMKRSSGYRLYPGVVTSADAWNNELDRINKFVNEHDSVCEEMELFAVAQVCDSFKIPWIGLRVLSNNIVTGEEWDPDAARISQIASIDLVKAYINK